MNLNITQRQVTLGALSLLLIGTIAGAVLEILKVGTLIHWGVTLAAIPISAGLLFMAWRGGQYERYSRSATPVVVAVLLLLITREPYLTQQVTLAIFLPSILALVLSSLFWVIGCAVMVFVGLILLTEGQSIYTDDLQTLVIFTMVIGGMVLARLVTDTAYRKAEENARQAEEARDRAEHQARELIEANELMSDQLDQQGQLLELVTTLETPVVPLAEGMLFAPIVGHIDSRRAQALTTRLLEQTSVQRARLVVLDIAGVAVVDTAVAQSLLHMVQALRLLGCEVILSGISASVALALIHLGVNLEEVRTVRSPQEALAQFLNSTAQTPGDQPMHIKKDALLPIKPNGQVPNN